MVAIDKFEQERILQDYFFSLPDWKDTINEEDIFGETPLYKTLQEGYTKFAEALIMNGARYDVEIPGEYTLLTLLYVDGTKATVRYLSEANPYEGYGGGKEMLIMDCLFYAAKCINNRSVVTRLNWLLTDIWQVDINRLGVEIETLAIAFTDSEEDFGFVQSQEIFTYTTVLDIAVNNANVDLLKLYLKLGGKIALDGVDYLGYIRKIKKELQQEELSSSTDSSYFDNLRMIRTLLVRHYNREMRGAV